MHRNIVSQLGGAWMQIWVRSGRKGWGEVDYGVGVSHNLKGGVLDGFNAL
jgi:hypothetical protein